MSGEIIEWPKAADNSAAQIAQRLGDMKSILYAIEAGELLAALPDCPIAQAHHRAAISLLAVLERDLDGLLGDLAGG